VKFPAASTTASTRMPTVTTTANLFRIFFAMLHQLLFPSVQQKSDRLC
jgi:hypothetical protein